MKEEMYCIICGDNEETLEYNGRVYCSYCKKTHIDGDSEDNY